MVVTELVAEEDYAHPGGRRRLNAAGYQAAAITTKRLAEKVDALLEKRWDRHAGQFERRG